ncbi:hypothetical protein [Dysgonomonas mossii]|uniref:hypothetical protein n=1 Tax=Dysgonomonas mossii TaxID=163665 RepID=UPI00399583E5
MKRRIVYPYTLEKKDKMIKLEISGGKFYIFLHIFVFFLAIVSVIGLTFSFFINDSYTIKDYFVVCCLLVFMFLVLLFAFYTLKWKRKGKEIFILYPDKLEYIIENKPFRTQRKIHHFTTMMIAYNIEIEFDNNNDYEIKVYTDLQNIEGNFSIIFYMDEGENIIYSEREVPIEVMRTIREEYLININEDKENIDTLSHTQV